jgi:hypothetical protein
MSPLFSDEKRDKASRMTAAGHCPFCGGRLNTDEFLECCLECPACGAVREPSGKAKGAFLFHRSSENEIGPAFLLMPNGAWYRFTRNPDRWVKLNQNEVKKLGTKPS